MLSNLLGLTDVQIGALYYLRRRLGKSWIEKLLAEGEDDQEGPTELDILLDEGKLHGGTLGAIQRKLGLFRRFGFLQPRVHRGRGGQDHGVPRQGDPRRPRVRALWQHPRGLYPGGQLS